MRSSILSLVGSIALAVAAFLPWLRLGDIGLAGIPDPVGFFVLALGLVGVILTLIKMFARSETRHWLVLVGLASLTALIVVWLTGPRTIEDRAQAHAEAVAIVDNVAAQPVPSVRVGYGLVLGLLGAALVIADALGAGRRQPEIHAPAPEPTAATAPAQPPDATS